MEIKLNKQCVKSVEIDCAALMLLVEISILGKVVNENWWSVCTMHSAMAMGIEFPYTCYPYDELSEPKKKSGNS